MEGSEFLVSGDVPVKLPVLVPFPHLVFFNWFDMGADIRFKA